jgi:hypothetical protein
MSIGFTWIACTPLSQTVMNTFHINKHICAYLKHMKIRVYMRAYIHTYIHMHIPSYVWMHAHTHTHTIYIYIHKYLYDRKGSEWVSAWVSKWMRMRASQVLYSVCSLVYHLILYERNFLHFVSVTVHYSFIVSNMQAFMLCYEEFLCFLYFWMAFLPGSFPLLSFKAKSWTVVLSSAVLYSQLFIWCLISINVLMFDISQEVLVEKM